jgi:MFS family permease
MNLNEIKTTLIVALIFAFRMLGVFMVFPILALYAQKLPGANIKTIGLALGAYGLTQALMQIFMGVLSDKYGRKPVMFIGLLIFALGGVVAALSNSINGLIIGRAISGAGAIGAVAMAWVADTTRVEVRTRAMAIVGITIGFSFALAMVLGPVVSANYGLSAVFWLTSICALVGCVLLFTTRSNNNQTNSQITPEKISFKKLLKNTELIKLMAGIFILHTVLSSCFLFIPIKIKLLSSLPQADLWKFYLPVLIAAITIIGPIFRLADKEHLTNKILSISVVILFTVIPLIGFYKSNFVGFAILMAMFFASFNILEATLPSLASKVVPATSKGAALGLYSTSQFLGVFVGGALGGWLYQLFDIKGIITLVVLLLTFWLILLFDFRSPSTVKFVQP